MGFNVCLITSPLPKIKGVQILVDNFLQILNPLAEEIYIITGNYQNELFYPNLKVINLKSDDKRQALIIRIFQFISTQFKMSYNILKIRNNIDVIIFFISTPFIIPMITAKLLGKHTIMIATGSSAKGAKQFYKKSLFGLGSKFFFYIFKFIEKFNYHLSDRIVVLSKRLVCDLDLTKYQGKIDYACATFVDTNHFSIKTNLKDRDDLVGFIGRLTETKGIMQFVETIPRFSANKQINFLIGGDGHLRDEVEKKLMKNGLSQRVTFAGWISHNDLPDYLNKLKLLVVPSYTEAFPAAALEAMACGTPVLITPVGGVCDIITDGKTAFIMDNNTPECIESNIKRVFDHPNLEEIVSNARKLLENDFSYDNVTKKYKKTLKKVVYE